MSQKNVQQTVCKFELLTQRLCCRYYERAATMFWPRSHCWLVHCKAGLSHCLKTIQELIAEAASEAQHLVNAQQSANDPPSATTHGAQLHTAGCSETNHTCDFTANNQDAHDLADAVWTTFGQKLLRTSSDLNKFVQIVSHLDAPSLAARIVGRMCNRVSKSLVH